MFRSLGLWKNISEPFSILKSMMNTIEVRWTPLDCLVSIVKSPNTPKTLLAVLSAHQKLPNNGTFLKKPVFMWFPTVWIPNRPECLSDLIQTAKSSEFCPSVTRLLVQGNLKTKSKKQNQLEVFFSTSYPLSSLSSEQQVMCFQTDLKLNPLFQIYQLPSGIS